MTDYVKYSILVPVDFTDQSFQALQYAAGLLRKKDGIIHLLHVVDDYAGVDHTLLNTQKEKLFEYARKNQELFAISIVPNIVTGNIFHSIGETAAKLGAKLIVMGTHPMSSIQFLIGSFAARVILGSTIPVLLTNGNSRFRTYQNIVLPFDYHMNMDLLLQAALQIGQKYNSKIHLFSQSENLSFFAQKRKNFKIKQALYKIKKKKLECQNVMLESESGDFTDNILKYAESVDADLLISNLQKKTKKAPCNEYLPIHLGVKLLQDAKIPLLFEPNKTVFNGIEL